MGRNAHSSLLPPLTCRQIREVTDRARAGRDPGPALPEIVSTLATLDARHRQQIASEIQKHGLLYAACELTAHRDSVLGGFWGTIAGPDTRQRQHAALARSPLLAHLYIFHGDGYLREDALDKWPATPNEPLMLVAIADRLNDWVPEVRSAASRCATKWFPSLLPESVASAFGYLVERHSQLLRWSPVEQAILEGALYQPAVLKSVARQLIDQTLGPAGRILRSALRRDGLDADLPSLASHAALPTVRAVALETLLRGTAQWRIGTREEWIDKRFGHKRFVPVFAERPLTISVETEPLMQAHHADPSPQVRKAVASALIDRLETSSPALKAMAQKLAGDRNTEIARKAHYFLEHAEGQSEPIAKAAIAPPSSQTT